MKTLEENAERIADALEEMLEIQREARDAAANPEAMIKLALDSLRKTNPVFEAAFTQIEEIMQSGENDAAPRS